MTPEQTRKPAALHNPLQLLTELMIFSLQVRKARPHRGKLCACIHGEFRTPHRRPASALWMKICKLFSQTGFEKSRG